MEPKKKVDHTSLPRILLYCALAIIVMLLLPVVFGFIVGYLGN